MFMKTTDLLSKGALKIPSYITISRSGIFHSLGIKYSKLTTNI